MKYLLPLLILASLAVIFRQWQLLNYGNCVNEAIHSSNTIDEPFAEVYARCKSLHFGIPSLKYLYP